VVSTHITHEKTTSNLAHYYWQSFVICVPKLVFPNYNIAIIIQGTYLLDALNLAFGLAGPLPTTVVNAVPQLLNVNVTYDLARPPGVRVVSVSMRNPDTSIWSPLDPNQLYYLCLPKYVPNRLLNGWTVDEPRKR
jgi:hypothetical protein